MTAFIHKDLQNKDYVEWMQFLRKANQWKKKQIQDYQISEIKRILNLAYQNTIGYKTLFGKTGLTPNKINSFEDFRQIPFTTKKAFQDDLESFSIQKNSRIYVTTGGSTGIPMGMYRDKVSFAKELASKAHQYYRIGWKEGDRQIVFRGLPIETLDNTEFVEEFNELRCSTYQFLPEKMEVYRQKAVEYEPEWIRCYPSAGYLFASFLEENKLPFPKLKGILCASEMLYDFQKEKLEKVFNCRVFSHYGHYEMSALAGFCEYTDDYHVLPQYSFVELIDQEGSVVREQGKIGEIVATSFIMEVTPFIRYRTGDLAVYKSDKCEACGRPYQIWEKVVGRRQEYIVSKNNRLISMTMLNMHDDIYDDFRQIQFYQNELGKVILRYVPKNKISINKLTEIKKRLTIKLGNDIEIAFQSVENIEFTKRGKHKTLVQELKLDDKILTLN
jgi:phenylacetate-CoA ligase